MKFVFMLVVIVVVASMSCAQRFGRSYRYDRYRGVGLSSGQYYRGGLYDENNINNYAPYGDDSHDYRPYRFNRRDDYLGPGRVGREGYQGEGYYNKVNYHGNRNPSHQVETHYYKHNEPEETTTEKPATTSDIHFNHKGTK